MKKELVILQDVLKNVKPSKKELSEINETLQKFLKDLHSKLSSMKIDAEVFIGGSFAKKTLIKKNYYDIDIFLRFSQKYNEDEIKKLSLELFKKINGAKVVHGSRDYAQIKMGNSLLFEIIPVLKVKSPKDSNNITDLSYSHVKYINKKIKTEKILDDILLAKAFCHATKCYGAESYIKGFSGYGIELLVYHYGGFLKFLNGISKAGKPLRGRSPSTVASHREKIIIDLEKSYKNKQEILMDINSAKLQSPIILVDPTYKQRNALAALSQETFEKFQKECQKFLKNPNIKSFEDSKIDLEKMQKDAKKKKQEFILLEAKTDKQEGDIAGSKLLKFYNYFNTELSKSFVIKRHEFEYNDGKSAKYLFVVKKKEEVIFNGPFAKDVKNVLIFKKAHKNTFVKSGKIYAREKVNLGIKEFFKKWSDKNKNIIKEMSIIDLKVI